MSMSSRTNDEWVWALQQSGAEEREALAELRHYLYRAVFVYLRDHRTDLTSLSHLDLQEMAEDFAQEALLTIRASLEQFQGKSKFTTWAYRFVINQAAGELRRRYYRGKLSYEQLAETETAVLSSVVEAKGLDPDLAAERQDVLNQLLQIIETELNDRQRTAVISVHFEGRSMQEVAEQLGTTPNTLYKMLYDARKKIKAALLARHLSAGDLLALFDVWL